MVPEMTGDTDLASIAAVRAQLAATEPSVDDLLRGGARVHSEHTVPTRDGGTITVSVFRSADHSGTSSPGIFYIHGGGMMLGTRFYGVEGYLHWVEEHDAVFASVEYRLAPEHPDPVPVEDCYAALVWFAEHADELGFSPDQILIMGGSAGGGLAAGTTLLARDRQGPLPSWQLLMCPMLDDRDATISSQQITSGVPWARQSNRVGWGALLGDRAGSEDVSIYAAPARADDVSGLPPAFLDCGDVEVFRDEVVAYAGKLWAAGINAELHVWAGAFHGFTMFANASVAVESQDAVNRWVRRQFSRRNPDATPE